MTRTRRFRLARLGLVLVLLLAALPLTGCGRKGRLQPPPGTKPANSDVHLPRIHVPASM